jgi:hypothetical protein
MSDSTEDIGVLLVHGIGNQKQGETLTEWGMRILDSLKVHGEVVIRTSRLRPDAHGSPAHVKADVRTDRSHFSLLMAEAWWADDFPKATFRALAFWSIRSVPWTVVSHFDERFRRAGNALTGASDFSGRTLAMVNVLLEMVWLFVGLLMAPLLVAALFLLLSLSIIPYDPLRQTVLRILELLSGTLGDSCAFASNDVISHAISSAVADKLVWLKQRSNRQIILAHSQGAAVTHRMLRECNVTNCAEVVLITFGSGIRKLHELLKLGRSAPDDPRGRSALDTANRWAYISTLCALAAASAMFGYGVLGHVRGASFVIVAVALPFLVALLGLLTRSIIHLLYYEYFSPGGHKNELRRDNEGARSDIQRKVRAESLNRRVRISKRMNVAGLVMIAALAGVLTYVNWLGFNRISFTISVLLGGSFTALMYWRYAAGRVTSRLDHEALEEEAWTKLNLAQVSQWHDYYARLDPVCNGAIMEFHKPKKLKSYELSNTENILTDHNSYWDNWIFRSYVAAHIINIAVGRSQIDVFARSGFSFRANVLFRILAVLVAVGWPLALIVTETSPNELFSFFGLPPYIHDGGIVDDVSELSSNTAKALAMLHWAAGSIAFIVVYLLSLYTVGRMRRAWLSMNSLWGSLVT